MIETDRVEERSMMFGGLDITYDDRVLEPRPWTLRQSLWAEEILAGAPPGDVLELCSGAGHIGMRALAHSRRRLVMVDVDAVACTFARRNAEAAGMAARVEIRHMPIDAAMSTSELFSLIIADPPWVPTANTDTFPDDPLLAIDGGDDGLLVARLCVETAAAHLVEGGSMLLQLGTADQASAICQDTPFEIGDLITEPGRGVVAHLLPSRAP